MATEQKMIHALIGAVANAVEQAPPGTDMASVAFAAAQATGLRRAVWATLGDRQRAAVIRAAIRRAKPTCAEVRAWLLSHDDDDLSGALAVHVQSCDVCKGALLLLAEESHDAHP